MFIIPMLVGRGVQQPALTLPNGEATGDKSAEWSVFANKGGGTVFAAARLSASAVLSKTNIENGTGLAVATGSDSSSVAPDVARTGTVDTLTAATEYVFDFFFRDRDSLETDVVSSAAFTTDAALPAGTYDAYHAPSGAVPVLILDFNNEVYAADTGSGLAAITTSAITNFTARVVDGSIGRMRTEDATTDQPSFPIASFDYNASGTTVQAWFKPGVIDSFDRLFSFQGDGSNRAFCYFSSSKHPRFRIDNAGAIQIAQLQASPTTDSTALGVTAGWSTTAIKMSVDGATVLSNPGTATIPTFSDLDIGHESGVEQPDGGCQRLVVWDTLLSDSDMEALSPISAGEGGDTGGGGGGGGGSSITPDFAVSGTFGASGQYNLSNQPYEYVSFEDASFVSFPGTSSSRVMIQNMNGPRVLAYGGTLTSTISQTTPWDTLYSNPGRTNQAGVHYRETGGGGSATKFILSGWDCDGCWDAIRPKNIDFIIHRCMVTNGRDDAIEADGNNSGQVIECLLESMVALSMTDANNASDEINIIDSILCGLTYPHDSSSDVRTFGPIKVNSGDARDWTAENVILAAEGVTTGTSSHNRFRYMWSHLKSSTGTNYFCNLSDTTIAAAGAPTPPSSWTVLEGQEARDFYNTERANWIATYRPYSFNDPEA